MTDQQLLQKILAKADINGTIIKTCGLSGGCIHSVHKVTLSDGRSLVVKLNDAKYEHLFAEEAAGLNALDQTQTVLTPKPLCVCALDDTAALIMTAITSAPADDASWSSFGKELAALHSHDAQNRFGFEADNHIGLTPQPNAWSDDWAKFNKQQRLGHQLNLAINRNLINQNEQRKVTAVIDRLDEFIPTNPKPSLLHGDLWSGNALPAIDDNGKMHIAVIDPACYIGDGWADIAMMKLFGGFPNCCYEAYENSVSDLKNINSRIAVYQLYHVLNHVNLFGRSYMQQAMNLADQLLS